MGEMTSPRGFVSREKAAEHFRRLAELVLEQSSPGELVKIHRIRIDIAPAEEVARRRKRTAGGAH